MLTADWIVKLAREVGLTVQCNGGLISSYIIPSHHLHGNLLAGFGHQPKANCLCGFSRFRCSHSRGVPASRHPYPDADLTVLFKRSAINVSCGPQIYLMLRITLHIGYHSSFHGVPLNPAAWQARPPFKNVCAVNMRKEGLVVQFYSRVD